MKKKKGKYPRFSGGDDQATKPDIRRRKPAKGAHAHDEFEIDIDVEFDPEATAIDEPLYTGEGVTDELTAPQDDEIKTQQTDLPDLELPGSSGDEVLPVYRSSRKSLKPTRKQDPPPVKPAFPKTPIPTSDKQDILELFDDPENASLSVELPPVRDIPSPKPSPPIREPDEFEIVGPGGNTGVRPLDGDLFDSRPLPRKKKDRQWLGPTAPPPMAHSEQIVPQTFKFTLKHLILVVLILILAATCVLGWFFYQDYLKRQELKGLDQGRVLIEKTKDEAIQDTAKTKDEDIPYKDKITTPKGGKSGKKK